jgi:hypothetical protein
MSHLEYTLTIKTLLLRAPQSKQTPIKLSPENEKIREAEDLLQNDNIPPLFPTAGR